MDNFLWKLNSFLYNRAPRLLSILQNFTLTEWVLMCICGFGIAYKLI